VLDGSGKVVGTVDLGPKDAGRHNFEWTVGSKPADAAYTFRVTATNGKAAVAGRTLARPRAVGQHRRRRADPDPGAQRQLPASAVVAFN
jgi:flagellar basal-body rod modification protein FlgD